jgi:hypothetical protein
MKERTKKKDVGIEAFFKEAKRHKRLILPSRVTNTKEKSATLNYA